MTTPNIYQLHGGQIVVNYSTGELGSIKAFEYQDALQSLNFKGDDIRTVQTEIGTLVTVTIRRTIDTGFTFYHFFVPRLYFGRVYL